MLRNVHTLTVSVYYTQWEGTLIQLIVVSTLKYAMILEFSNRLNCYDGYSG